ncbi:hypothetical protein KORDIASMS9_04051 [Kordia sp. SMS9]|uniref:hypothetical protein n=1 Tax=Kordia sp. SMS9 TaxID=2282170 RepID=UPI000E0D6E29|nr:hypothetical protein [Kordia sp. SMS9]AXG71793.1 hypothetical protein KORDIASMS9_04051 [Kordia sp. SMS9]
MTSSRDKEFHSKLILFIVVVMLLKFVYLVVTSIIANDFPSFLVGFIILALVLFGFILLLNFLFEDNNTSRGSGAGGTSTIGDRQFDTLAQYYEKITNDFIEKKQFKKAAYVQLRLLQNPYRAASILKDGHLYNEAAYVYLKKCHYKEDAAECYELARSYTKSIKLYKELNMNEKVGDLYQKMDDTKKANHHYQIVVDDYSKNYQYVKASLLYRKKMDNVIAANELLLKGWNENKDAVNCANNYFANFKNKAALEKELHDFKAKRTNTANECNFLKALTHEYNKDIAPKEDIQFMAYELISKHHKNEEILSLLKHFVTDDTQLTKDILRYRMKKE